MGEYKCKRCGKSALEANLAECEHAPCPMEYVTPDAQLVSAKLWKRTKITLLVLSILLVIAISIIITQYRANKTANLDTSYFDRKIERLESENDSLYQMVELSENDIIEYDRLLDSLQKIKPEIQIKYVKIYEKVDNATTIELVNLTDSILSTEGIRR